MVLSQETLGSLDIVSFTLKLKLNGDELVTIVKRYTDTRAKTSGSTQTVQSIILVFTPAFGYQGEIWIPTIRRICNIQRTADLPISIREIWTVDVPNTGDAAILNEPLLLEKYLKSFDPTILSIAVTELLQSGLVDRKNNKVIGISHSGGLSGFLVADSDKQPFDSLILIEPPFWHLDARPLHEAFATHSVAAIMNQIDIWPNIEEALTWHKKRRPWKRWHPEVLKVFVETHFRPLPTPFHSETEGVTYKTYKGHHAAIYGLIDTFYDHTKHLPHICGISPVHILLAERKDLWVKPLAKANVKAIADISHKLASLNTVPNTGHFMPQEDPDVVAHTLVQTLIKPATSAVL